MEKRIEELAEDAIKSTNRLKKLLRSSLKLEDTDEHCINSVVSKIEDYSDTETFNSPFLLNNKFQESHFKKEIPSSRNKFTQNNIQGNFPRNLFIAKIKKINSKRNIAPIKEIKQRKSKVKLLKKELFHSSKALQENIHLSYILLNEVNRLDNTTIDLLHDKNR